MTEIIRSGEPGRRSLLNIACDNLKCYFLCCKAVNYTENLTGDQLDSFKPDPPTKVKVLTACFKINQNSL